MASFDTTHYGLQKPTRANTSRNATPNITDGEVTYARIPYTLAGTEASNDTINLCILPAGAIPMPGVSSVTCSQDPGTTLTLDIGNANDPDGWADGIVLSSGGQVACTNTAIPAWATTNHQLVPDTGSGNCVIYATVASANTLTAGTVLMFTLGYKLNK